MNLQPSYWAIFINHHVRVHTVESRKSTNAHHLGARARGDIFTGNQAFMDEIGCRIFDHNGNIFGRALVRTPISGLYLHPPPRSHSSHSNIRINGQAYNCLIHFYKIAYHDNLRWKMTLDGRQHLIEDDP